MQSIYPALVLCICLNINYNPSTADVFRINFPVTTFKKTLHLKDLQLRLYPGWKSWVRWTRLHDRVQIWQCGRSLAVSQPQPGRAREKHTNRDYCQSLLLRLLLPCLCLPQHLVGKLYVLDRVDASNHVRGLLGNHDRRRAGVAARNFRHDRRVDYAEAFNANHPAIAQC